jgi:hypothetical protein
MRSVSSACPSCILCGQVILLNLIDHHFVLVNCRTQNQVCCLCLYLDVPIGGNLIEPEGESNSEDSFPSNSPGQAVVQLIRELHSIAPRIKLRVVVEIP